MSDARAYLDAIMDMATGVLHQHGNYSDETDSIHGPLDHIDITGAALDEEYRKFILDDPSITRSDFVELVRANPSEGVVLSVSLDDGEAGLDTFIPLTASLLEAHAVVKKVLNDYVERHFD